ncbi:MAG: tetratricopeptide repeat protein [Rickettsia endosymbiont of Oxypoda opaca]|nr:tetratricopeptide repeat protein [Rickettsia endosymbiont of Oxypoda opaca]
MKNKTLQDYSEQEETLLASGDLEAMEAFIEECYRQGHTYFERGAFQEAAEFFQYVSELNREYPDIYYHMGIAFYKSNNNRQAYIAFKKAIKFDSHNTEIINLMKNVQKKLGIKEDSSNNSDFQIITASISSSYNDDMVIVDKRILTLLGRKFQEYDEKFERYGEMLQCVETRVSCVETRVSFLEEIAHITGAPLQAKINTAIKELNTRGNKDLLHYYKKFYWTLQDVFDACGNINTELTVANGGQIERLSITSAQKFLCYFLDVLPGIIPLCGFSGIPLYGCLIGTIHDAFDNWYNTTLTKTLLTKVYALNDITHSKFNSKTEVMQVLQQLAIIFAHLKKENLVAVEVNEENSALKTVVNFLKTKIFLIQEKAYSSVGIKIKGEKIDDEVTKLAFQDATLLISYLYNNSKDLVENPKEFIEQIIEVTKQGQLSEIWLNDKIKQNSSIGIEYELYEIAKKVPDPIKETISKKAAIGQWEDYNPWLWGTKESGIGTILKDGRYNCAKDITPSNEEINIFRIFVLQEMCTTIAKAGINKTNPTCLKKFKEHYPEIVTTVRDSLPWLLKKGEIVEIFVDDEPTKLHITQMLSKTEPKIEKFFMERMDKALITDNFYISAQSNAPYKALGETPEHNDTIAIA